MPNLVNLEKPRRVAMNRTRPGSLSAGSLGWTLGVGVTDRADGRASASIAPDIYIPVEYHGAQQGRGGLILGDHVCGTLSSHRSKHQFFPKFNAVNTDQGVFEQNRWSCY